MVLRRCLLVVLAGALSALTTGCSNPEGLPRPSDAGFIDWLNGQRVTSAKGVIFDDVWRIDPGEVSDFKVVRITNNPADHIYTATVSFRATAKGRGIQVSEGAIRYKNASEPGKLQFVDFVPVSVARIGN
jgi:hypothetical protein